MNFIAQKCDCCDDIAFGIECNIEDLQQTEDGTVFLTLDRDDVGNLFASIDNFIGGRTPTD